LSIEVEFTGRDYALYFMRSNLSVDLTGRVSVLVYGDFSVRLLLLCLGVMFMSDFSGEFIGLNYES